jgi:uncharacterized protein YegL
MRLIKEVLTMDKNTTELVFILDRSGSMSGLEDVTIGGFNGMLAKQKAEEQAVNVTTVLFDDKVDIIHDRFPISIVQPLTEKDYYVRGCTALLDAVGESIRKIENVQEHLPEDHKASKVIFVITTDGHENSSRKFTYSEIKRMIEAKKEMGWEFLFLGANIDAVEEAAKLGINRNRAVTYENDSKGVALNYEVVGSTLRKAVACDEEDMHTKIFDDDWAEAIEEYHNQKSRK